MMPNLDVEWFHRSRDVKIEATASYGVEQVIGRVVNRKRVVPAGGSSRVLGRRLPRRHSVGFDNNTDFASTLNGAFATSMTSLPY